MAGIYETRQERDNLWIIGERYSGRRHTLDGALTICLVVGEHTAAVLDAGMGISPELRTICEGITDKPLICLVGHGHPDHAGGAAQFDRVFMSKLDDLQLAWSLRVEKRLKDVEHFSHGDAALCEFAAGHLLRDETLEYEDIRDGQRFDLGGVVLEAVAVPGHTLGSMCFVNWHDNYAYTSDCMNPTAILGMFTDAPEVFPTPMGSYPVEAYRDNLRRFLGLVPDSMALYMGHLAQPTTTQVPKGLVAVCDEILAGVGGAEMDMPPFEDQSFVPHSSKHTLGRTRVFYDADNLTV